MPKIKYTRELIFEEACKLAKAVGIKNLSIRLIAKEVGCSVVPIYTYFENYESLESKIIEFYEEKLFQYCNEKTTSNVFFNMGIGMLKFADEYSVIFNEIINIGELINSDNLNNRYIDTMNTSAFGKLLDEKTMKSLIRDMSIFTYGLCMSMIEGEEEYVLNDFIDMLYDVGESMTVGVLVKKLNILKLKLDWGK